MTVTVCCKFAQSIVCFLLALTICTVIAVVLSDLLHLHFKPWLGLITSRSATTGMVIYKTAASFGLLIWNLIIPLFALILLFSGQQIHLRKWIDVSKMVRASVATRYQTELGSRLVINPPKNVDEHWLQLHDTIKVTSKVAYSLAKRSGYKH